MPAGTILRLQSKAVLQSPALETNVKPAGVTSDTKTSLASLEPAFETTIVKIAFVPGTRLAGGVLTMLRLALETMVVGSLALSLLVFCSPPPATLAVLVRLAAASWATATVTLMAG